MRFYSVILPAYNAESTLERCVESIAKAKKNFEVEVVLVDDGSTDQTSRISEALAQRYDWIRYIRKQNGGVATARNLALDAANGDYIAFVDADDTISENYFSRVDTEFSKSDVDMVVFGHSRIGSDGKVTNKFNKDLFLGRDDIKDLQLHVSKNSYLFFSLSVRVVKRWVIEGVTFNPKIKMGSDTIFVLKIMMRSRSIRVVPDVIYDYRETPGSITSGKYKENLLASFEEYYRDKVSSHYWPDDSYKRKMLSEDFSSVFFGHILMYLLNNVRGLPFRERYSELKNIRSSFVYKELEEYYKTSCLGPFFYLLTEGFFKERYFLVFSVLHVCWAYQLMRKRFSRLNILASSNG